ncbi:MAG: tRNA-dihydrouridine synthase [Treponema sp.]|nr:tRNA-dihydrouridine synthase [Treponema sp.]
MKRLETEYGGLKLRSPVILASAGITKAHSNVEKADKYGAGAVVLKTLFQEPLMARSPTPRFIIIKRGEKDYSSVTNLSYEQGYEHGIDQYCGEIRSCKADFETKIIASIGCGTPAKWEEWAKMVEAAGADAIEMNLSCPHSDYVMSKLGQINEFVSAMVPVVKKAVSIPVYTKLTPQIENPAVTSKIMEESGSCGVTAFSRCLGMDIDIDNQVPVLHGGYGGHGGPWAIHYALRWISEMYTKLKIPISGCGGVVEWQDIVKYILSGATTVQVCFLIYTYGYSIIEKLNNGLLQYMEKHGYESIKDFRGTVVPRIKGLTQVDRDKTRIAKVDPAICVGCGRCSDICIYNGIDFADKKASVNEKCDGCGLCLYFCPKKAILLDKK